MILLFTACSRTISINLPDNLNTISGEEFYNSVNDMDWHERENRARDLILSGNVPDHLRKFVPIPVELYDSISQKYHQAQFFASSDYLAIGHRDDWARIPLMPMTAQEIADSLDCFLPTPKLVDQIYRAARVKLRPMPMFAFRDSIITMYHHHLIIEGQRQGRKGLIAGIKKDIVITAKLDNQDDRVAIYGWHRKNGTPIQPLYTGHVNWYVDYSHGTRLIYRKILMNGKWMDYEEILNDPTLRYLITDEEANVVTRYSY